MHGYLVEKVNTTLDPVTEAEHMQCLKLKEHKKAWEQWEYFLEALRKAGFLPAVAPPAH